MGDFFPFLEATTGFWKRDTCMEIKKFKIKFFILGNNDSIDSVDWMCDWYLVSSSRRLRTFMRTPKVRDWEIKWKINSNSFSRPSLYLQCVPTSFRGGIWTERACPDTLVFIGDRCDKYDVRVCRFRTLSRLSFINKQSFDV